MVIRKMEQNQFERLHQSLIMKAHVAPLDASYTVKMKVKGIEYDVKVQPKAENEIAILQALRIERYEEGVDFELITRGNILASLFENMMDQGIR